MSADRKILQITELGTSDNYLHNLTLMHCKAKNIVTRHITDKYCVKNPLWVLVKNSICILVVTEALR